MKKLNYKKMMLLIPVLVGGLYACKESFLERVPVGQISGETLKTKAGVNGLLIGAYSLLDGVGAGYDDHNTSIWNAWLGDVGADDARKGGGYCCQTERGEIENKKYNATNAILNDRWRLYYAGVQRANEAIRGLDNLPDGEFTEEEATQVRAEARLIRGIFHLEAAKVWRNVPYVDETVTFSADNYRIKNDVSVWPKIEDDFKYAADNLTATKAQIGRGNKWAAKAFLAKTYMFQQKFAEAKPILEDIIANGTTSGGTHYKLIDRYGELFQPIYENNSENVFTVQMSVNDGGLGRNGNAGESFNYPGFLNPSGWGHQPTFNLANTYKTVDGLPMLDDWNQVDIPSDMGLDPVTDPFTPYAGPLDPRLDWVLGRRGIPFHDWGLKKDKPDVGGPYVQKKNTHWKKDEGGKTSEVIDGWQQASGINYPMIRFADVLLWAAEVEVEIGDLQDAEDYVNIVRNRAANPDGFLKKYVNDNNPAAGFSNTPAANYQISPYDGEFVANGKTYARKAVHFERRLELAMEGHRFFDLQRYDALEPGYMADVLNAHMAHETATQEALTGFTYQIFDGANFIEGRHELYAIPQQQIDQSAEVSGPTLTQNPGHN